MNHVCRLGVLLVASHLLAWTAGRQLLTDKRPSEGAGSRQWHEPPGARVPWTTVHRPRVNSQDFQEAWRALHTTRDWNNPDDMPVLSGFLRDWYREDPESATRAVGELGQAPNSVISDVLFHLDLLSLDRDPSLGLRRLHGMMMTAVDWQGLHLAVEADRVHTPIEKLEAIIGLPDGMNRKECLKSLWPELDEDGIEALLPRFIETKERRVLESAATSLAESRAARGDFIGAASLLERLSGHCSIKDATMNLVRQMGWRCAPAETIETLKQFPPAVRAATEEVGKQFGLLYQLCPCFHTTDLGPWLLDPDILPLVRNTAGKEDGFQSWAGLDHRQGATLRAWALQIPVEDQNAVLFEKAVSAALRRDPSSARDWVESLPAGWQHDHAAMAAARALRWRQRPDEAEDCIASIADPALRAKATKEAVEEK